MVTSGSGLVDLAGSGLIELSSVGRALSPVLKHKVLCAIWLCLF